MALTVQDLVTKFDEFSDETIVQVLYKGVGFHIDSIEKCEVTDNAVLNIGLDSSETDSVEHIQMTHNRYEVEGEESEDEE